MIKNRIKQLIEVDWQNLKAIQPEDVKIQNNLDALKASLKKHGFSLPFAVWIDGADIYTIDGHTRKKALQELQAEGVEIPDKLKAFEIEAKNRKEAVEILVEVFNQKHNPFNNEVLVKWLKVEQVEVQDLEIINVDYKFGDSGNDWNYNYKDLPQDGDGLEDKLGFKPHSMWYDYPRTVDGISEKMIALPERNNSNPHQHKYSRTSVEEIRRIVLTYMREGDFFLENCCGWSTFGSIAAIHGYKGIGIDIWETALEYSRKQIQEVKGNVEILEMDGMDTDFSDEKFDYVYCNPPFMDVEIYSGKENDISGSNDEEFNSNFEKLMMENYRILKKDKLCTITISDTRKRGVISSLLNVVLNSAFKANFKLHDFVIVEVLGVANMYRKKAFENKRMPKNHEYVITFVK